MKNTDYTIQLSVDLPATEVFKRINAVTAWWTENLEGSSQKLNDVFTVRFWDMHASTQKLIEVIPDKKIVWLVTDSNLTFIKHTDEWTDTTISFEITEKDNRTQILFIHHGLIPEIECYTDCTKGWDHYINGSLLKLLTEGKGKPEKKE